MITVTANCQTDMLGVALCHAEEALNAMETWSSAVDVIKLVMDAVSPIAAVCPVSFCLSLSELTPILQLQPYANLAWSLLSKIPEVCLLAFSGYIEHSFLPCCQTLLQQVQCDDNVQTLFQVIHDAFEFAEDADALRSIKPKSRQARILEEMLQCVSEIGKFIKLYVKHVGVSKSS
jgi:hypothetical protein